MVSRQKLASIIGISEDIRALDGLAGQRIFAGR